MMKQSAMVICFLLFILCASFVSSKISIQVIRNDQDDFDSSLTVMRTRRDNHQQNYQNNQKIQKDSSNTQAGGSRGYDQLVLATEWAGSVCTVKKCFNNRPPTKTFFNLHGLWPNDSEDYRKSPMGCKSSTLQTAKLPSDVQTLSNNFWNGMYNSQETFLNHEWTKHGTCWVPEPDKMDLVPADLRSTLMSSMTAQKGTTIDQQSTYIKMTVQLAQKYNVFKALAAKGILPSNQRRISKSDIQSAFSSYYKADSFQIICQKSPSGQSLLMEIRLCLDMNYSVVDCLKPKMDCADQILYPEYL